MSVSSWRSQVPPLGSIDVLKKELPWEGRSQAVSGQSAVRHTEHTDHNLSHLFEKYFREGLLSEHKRFSACVILGSQVGSREILASNAELAEELRSSVNGAIAVKTRRFKFNAPEQLKKFWQANYDTFISDIIGTSMLGPTVSVALLSELVVAQEERKSETEINALLLRLKVSIAAIGSLKIPEPQRELWKTRLIEAIPSIPIHIEGIAPEDRDTATKVSDFVVYHLLNSDLAAFEGKSLNEVLCWQKNDEAFVASVKEQFLSRSELELYPEIRETHVIAGAIFAALKEPSHADTYFSRMLDSLERIKDPLILAGTSESGDNIPRYKEIFTFVAEYAQNSNAQEIAKKALSGDPSNFHLAAQKIKFLDFSNSGLSNVPESITLFKDLRNLDLSSNYFKEVPPVIKDLSYLCVLNVRGNQLTEAPLFVEEMPNLVRLDILANPIRKVPVSIREIVWELPYSAVWTS